MTGASGFVGRHLVTTLRSRGVAVRRALRTADGAADGVVVGEIDEATTWGRALEGVSTVVHLAGLAHVDPRRVPDALATYRLVNCAGTLRLAAEAARAGVSRFVFVSTVKVNGESSGAHPFTAASTPAPTDPYGISKLEAEHGLRTGFASLDVGIVRPPLVYGPGVRANFLRLVDAVARGVPLPFGSIRNARSLVGVGNLCDLLARVATTDGPARGTWFVSDGEDLSTPELVRRIARALDRPARLLPVPTAALELAGKLTGRSAAIERLCGSLQVDISATRRAFDWNPPIDIDTQLARTVQWWRQNRRAAA